MNKRKSSLCEWPGCEREALCSSGNVNGALICEKHFNITNGKIYARLPPYEKGVMDTLAWSHREK